MTERRPTNLAASVHGRLRNLARASGEDMQHVLTRYVLERLLQRLSASPDCERFVLKGSLLFAVWSGAVYRPTRDIDLLGLGTVDEREMSAVFERLCATSASDDGVVFDAASVVATPIREEQEYGGVRVTLAAALGQARVRVQVDIGAGDDVVPSPQWNDFPTLLEMPKPRLRTYPRETVVAEKLHVVVDRGLLNSRLKDYADLSELCRNFDFDGDLLRRALAATFERRATALPTALPIGLSSAFATHAEKLAQWHAFTKRAELRGRDLGEVVREIATFIEPVLRAATLGTTWKAAWIAPGPWHE